MNLGAEPKKVVILGVLVVVGIGALYFNSSSESTPTTRTIAPVADTTTTVRTVTKSTKAQNTQSNGGEFRLRVLGSRPDDKVDPKDIDPELKLGLLAKVQAVEPIDAGRNLFQYGAAPPPPAPITLPKDVRKIEVSKSTGPPPSTQVLGGPRPVPTPPPTPINLKYYGYVVSKTDGRKEACLLDGEDIILATENQTIKQRYKIVHIALNSIDIEDTQAKNTQTLKFQDLPSS